MHCRRPTDDSTIALIQLPTDGNVLIKGLSIKISELNNRKCNLSALLDTGSPISFVNFNVYREFRDPSFESFLKRFQHVYKRKITQLSRFKMYDSVNSHLCLEQLPNSLFYANLHVLPDNSLLDMILGLSRINIICPLLTFWKNPWTKTRRNRIISGGIIANCLVLRIGEDMIDV